MVPKTKVYVHCLSAPPCVSASDKERLLHREIPGSGIMRCTKCLADAVLLLIASELLVECPWVRGSTETEAYFRDSDELIAHLADIGLATKVDSGEARAKSSELISQLVSRGLRDFKPWLEVLRNSAREWTQQEALVEQLWEATCDGPPSWRDLLRQVGLSTPKHNYRNQNQAITALVTLLKWEDSGKLDSALIREAIGRELLYLYITVTVAARAGAILHDWSDYLPLYQQLTGQEAKPLLSLRLPSLSAQCEEDVAELLASPELSTVRQLTAEALASGRGSAADIEHELLQVVPREYRAPYAYRQVSFYTYAPEFAACIGLPEGGTFAISKWRLTGLGKA